MKISDIVYKRLNGKLSKEELKRFKAWLDENEENPMLFSRLQMMKVNGNELPDFSSIDSDKAWTTTIEKYEAKKKEKSGFRVHHILRYASIFILLAGVSYFIWFSNTSEVTLQKNPDAITLTLDNGKIRTLVSGNELVIKDANGTVLAKKNSGQLDYSNNEIAESLVYNTLKIPNGKRFKLLLSDGSTIHLNAGSSLKYPVKFLKNQSREVFLTGEAYFDIARDEAHPFVVSNGALGIHVLGTEFNVMAYPEDTEINTVLVEGSVELQYRNMATTSHTILKPGEKAAWQVGTEKVDIEKVDTSVYTGWRNGKLVLRELRFEDIVKRLERHYNVSITNDFRELDYRMFTATFDVENIEEVLSTFAEETRFGYTIDESNVHIYQLAELK